MTVRDANAHSRGTRAAAAWGPALVAVACTLALWELAVRSGLLSDTSFPPMSETVAELIRLLGTGDFWSAVANTLQGWALGLGLAIAARRPRRASSSARAGSLYRALRVPIEFLRPIPSVALIPLAVLVYGTGLREQGLPRRCSRRSGRCSCRRSTASRTSTRS